MIRANPFPELMRAFFYEWLVEQRNASVHTVRSYRDTWRLFLRFIAQHAGKKVAMITLADLTASEVAGFLRHAEHERGGTIGTRNCRLAAIRSFFNFVATRDPALIAQCVEIHNIPVKRAPASEPLLSGSGRGDGDPCPASPFDTRMHAGSRVAILPLQQRSAHPGGARSVP